jgi:hypothetical protein
MFLRIVGWPAPDYTAPVKEVIILWFNHHATRYRYWTMEILIEVFGVAASCCLVGRYRRFGQKSYFHLQGWSVWREDLARLRIDRLQERVTLTRGRGKEVETARDDGNGRKTSFAWRDWGKTLRFQSDIFGLKSRRLLPPGRWTPVVSLVMTSDGTSCGHFRGRREALVPGW